MRSDLLTLLQINDSMFPIGSFTHSYGLESYIYQQQVTSAKLAEAYTEKVLRHSLYYNDAAFVNRAWKICDGKSFQYQQILELDMLVTALKAPSEIKQASHKLGLRFLKLAVELSAGAKVSRYAKSIKDGQATGHYAIAMGMYAQEAGISKKDTLTAFYYNNLNAMVTNCVKLVPLSQTVGQKILFNMQPLIKELVGKQDKVNDDTFGLCCIGQEIKCMQHEKQYSRLYIS
jgi:urease accessory protein